jgi:ubiquinone/menaquinone biosynthesis C-methylase UbiE
MKGLPFADKQFHTVIMGDIVEHLYDVEAGIKECARVCSNTLVMTIFEETRIPVGQHIKEAQEYFNNYNDSEVPHLLHINHFTEHDINGFIKMLTDFEVIEKLYEHETIGLYEWLIALRRIK